MAMTSTQHVNRWCKLFGKPGANMAYDTWLVTNCSTMARTPNLVLNVIFSRSNSPFTISRAPIKKNYNSKIMHAIRQAKDPPSSSIFQMPFDIAMLGSFYFFTTLFFFKKKQQKNLYMS
ncbi:hypothetical protein RFI_24180 [Reticulomyxa filosa]|uniref:Transmembrane protein n=1 Tax=Reticulomyxa filosa TaxID=46433 RepID=X6MJF2_RETFI|nr:hypothetical protein RFI_24180 [Reticulomyxa filosa]|eukprot:ETO13195.1 hypothetical protein RFI_24180 [Reticulomyxa filosa]